MSGMHSMVSPIAGSNLVTENHVEVTVDEFMQALREAGVELVEFRGKFVRVWQSPTEMPKVFEVEDYGNHEVSQVEALSPEEAVAKWTHESICEGSNHDMAVVNGRLYTAGPIRSLYWVSCDSEEVPDAEVWVETPPGFGGPSELPE